MTTQKNTSFLSHSEYKIILLFLYFTAIIVLLSLSGYTFLEDLDEAILQGFLSQGEPRTLTMSYPLSLLLSFLYSIAPTFSWYSIVILSYSLLISLLMAIYIQKLEYNKYFKISFFIISTLLLVYILFNVSITLITLLLIALSMPLIRNHPVSFWALLLLASFLRTEIIISLLPLLIIAYLLLFKKNAFTQKKLLVVLMFFSMVLVNYFSPSLNGEYREWLQFNKARTYFNDAKGLDKNNILTKDEQSLAHTWWIHDPALYPADKIIQAAGSKSDAILNKLLKKNILKTTLGKGYYNPILILFALLTFYMIYLEKNNLRKSYYFLFGLGFLVLILVRDVERVTLPLTVLWGILLYFGLLNKNKTILLKGLFFFSILYLFVKIPWSYITDYQQNEQLVNEFKEITNRNEMKLEHSIGFPTSMDFIPQVFEQNHLLQEKKWVTFDNTLLPASWLAMHPFFFESHDISFKNMERKYSSYYEYLIDDHTGIIGSKEKTIIDKFLTKNLLRMYDEKFENNNSCYHKVEIVDQSKNFIISRIVKKCEK